MLRYSVPFVLLFTSACMDTPTTGATTAAPATAPAQNVAPSPAPTNNKIEKPEDAVKQILNGGTPEEALKGVLDGLF